MTETFDPNSMFSGAPVSLTYAGVERGATTAAPKLSFGITSGAPDFLNAGGPIVGTRRNSKIVPSVQVTVTEFTAQKLLDAIPGSQSTSSESVGSPRSGLATTLAADPALGATNVKVASVTTVNVDDFVRIGPASPTEDTSEVVRVTTVGTTGGGGTGLDVVSDVGGGLAIDHANAEEVKTVTGTTLAAPAAVGATTVKLEDVTGLAEGDFVRFGYTGHYETRELATVGTAGAGGTGVTFTIPLTRDHAVGEWAIEVTTAGSTLVRPTIGRIGEAAHGDLVLIDLGADGRQLVVTLENALCTAVDDLTFDDDPEKPHELVLTFTAHYAAATPRVVPFTWELVEA